MNLTARWYVPRRSVGAHKAAIYLAADRFELAKPTKAAKVEQPAEVTSG